MDTFKAVLFMIAVLTSFACMVLLFRAYLDTRLRILLWSALCFVGLTVNNLLLFADLVILPETVDLRVYRHAAALAGMLFMIYGFIRESE
jgi:Na+/melibiose symporter-like transporter